jgi:dTMP kinase
MNTKKRFFVIEGADGTGKATQTSLLAERLEKDGEKVCQISFPNYTNNHLGKLIREALDGKHGDFLSVDPYIASTLYAVDRFESKEWLENKLEEGYVVITDRYVSANQIHQGAKCTTKEELDQLLTWLDTLEHYTFGLPRPTAVVYMDVPLEISLELIKKRALSSNAKSDLAESNKEHLEHVRRASDWLREKDQSWITIECARGEGATLEDFLSKEDVHERIYEKIQPYL